MRDFRLAITAAAVGLLLACGGCARWSVYQAREDSPALQRVPGEVPFLAQERRDDCGPAALASLLAYREETVPVATIREAAYHPKLGGTLLPDLENFARERGFESRSGRGDLDLLRRQIDAGRPVMVLVETGLGPVSRPHYLVLYGYTEEGFVGHGGTRPGLFVPLDDFLSGWERMSRLYLYLE